MSASRVNSGASWIFLLLAMAVGLPAIVLRFSGLNINPALASLTYGVAVVGGAFLLSWAAEAAQMDVSASLAIAVLAIITILPEYSVEAVLAWQAGHAFALNPDAAAVGLAAANVTGSVRLLMGLGWPVVVLAFYLKRRRMLMVEHGLPLEMSLLLIATMLTFLFTALGVIPLWLSAVLIGIYLFYLWMSSRKESEEPDLAGPSAMIGAMSRSLRRLTVLGLFAFSALLIVISAEPFVHGLIETGSHFGINDFFLIQWVAPLASESPEMVVATLFALRGNPVAGMAALVSAEVNQMTVLVGSMPAVFSGALGRAHGFPLDARQVEEFFFTGAFALFAIVLFGRMRLGRWHAGALLGVFLAQLVLPIVPGPGNLFPVEEGHFHRFMAYVLFGLTGLVLLFDFGRIKALLGMLKALNPRSSVVKEEPLQHP